jgi:hypothetical protein
MTSSFVGIQPFALPEGYYQSFSGTADGKSVRIWAIKANLEYFATITPDAITAPTPVTWNVPAGKVHRFPGDPSPFDRAAYTATRALPVTRGKAVPGKPFALEDANEFRVFSYVGALTTLYEVLQTKLKADCVLHTPSGRNMPLLKATPI